MKIELFKDNLFQIVKASHFLKIVRQKMTVLVSQILKRCITLVMDGSVMIKVWCSYRKTLSRGAYMDMILFEVFLKNIHLIPQDQIVQWHYL